MKELASDYMKACMAASVVKLLEDWPLDKIQVKQICEVSGYHRASWFRAFHSKHEAVTYHMETLWNNYCDQHAIKVRNEFSTDNLDPFFEYNYEIRDTLKLLYRRELMSDVLAAFHNILYEHHSQKPQEAYQAAMFAYSLFAILQEWVIRDFKESTHEMACILGNSQKNL